MLPRDELYLKTLVGSYPKEVFIAIIREIFHQHPDQADEITFETFVRSLELSIKIKNEERQVLRKGIESLINGIGFLTDKKEFYPVRFINFVYDGFACLNLSKIDRYSLATREAVARFIKTYERDHRQDYLKGDSWYKTYFPKFWEAIEDLIKSGKQL